MITKSEKLEKIIDYVEKHNTSAYVIAKNTKLTEAGIIARVEKRV